MKISKRLFTWLVPHVSLLLATANYQVLSVERCFYSQYCGERFWARLDEPILTCFDALECSTCHWLTTFPSAPLFYTSPAIGCPPPPRGARGPPPLFLNLRRCGKSASITELSSRSAPALPICRTSFVLEHPGFPTPNFPSQLIVSLRPVLPSCQVLIIC